MSLFNTLRNNWFQKNTRVYTLLILLFLMSAPEALYAKIWYVMYNGGPSNPNTSNTYATGSTDWAHAGWGIRQTVEAAADGDEIWVAGGDVNGDGLILKANDHYRMDYTMQLTKNIKIIGGFPRPNAISGVTEPTMTHRDMVKYATIFDGSTILIGGTSPQGIYQSDKKLFNMALPLTNASFDGFYVINGNSGWGAGIYMQAGLTISHCVFANNYSIDNSNLNLAGGGAIHATGGRIVNCILTNNQAKNKGGAVFLEGTAQMINCTVVNNKTETSGTTGAAVYLWGTDCRLYNTVLWNNSGGTNDADLGNGALAAQIKNGAYNRLSSPDASNTLINAANTGFANSPYFVTPLNTATPGVVAGWQFSTLGNWYLTNALSILWDKGENTYIMPYSSVDIVNRPRIRNGKVDIGAYEVQPLSISGAVIAPKTYDGTTVGAMTNNGTLNGVIFPDVVTIGSVSVVYADKNASNPKNVRLTYTLAGADGTKYFVEPIDTVFSIGKRPITVTADAKSKIYSNDATTDPTLSYQITSGSLVSGDIFTGSLTRVTGESVIAPGPTYQIQQGSLALSTNYTLGYVSSNLTITKKEVSISGITIADRVYEDGNVSAPISSWGTLSGRVGADNVTLVTTGITGSYATDETGANKLVTFSAAPTLTGTQSGNYFLTMPVVTGNVGVASTVITPIYPVLVYDGNPKVITSTHSPENTTNDIVTTTYYNTGSSVALPSAPADAGVYDVKIVVSGSSYNSTKLETYTITPKPITVTVANGVKTYDNTTASVVPALTLNGLIASDVANVSIKTNSTQPSASYTSQTAGVANRVIKVSGIELVGTRAFNYSVSSNAQNSTSTINKKVVSIVADSTSKVYDGTTDVKKMPTLSFSPAIMSGDVVTMSAGLSNAKFVTKEAGINKTVNVTGITLSGDSLLNYSILNSCSNSNCIVTRRAYPSIYIKADPVTKVYDGTRDTPLPALSLVGIVGADNVTVSTNAGTYGLYDNKNVGTGKEAGFVGIVLGGADLANYIISPNVTTYSNSITPKPVGEAYIVVADTSKIYDGKTSVAVPVLTIQGLVGGDNFTAIRSTATATFDNKNVGTGKTVTVTNFSFSDLVLAKNYTWATSYNNTNSLITPKKVNAINIKITERPYDAADYSAPVAYWGDIVGTITGEVLKIDSMQAPGVLVATTYANNSLGVNKTVIFTPSPLKLQGAEKNNYELIQPTVKGNIGINTSTVITISNYDVVYDGSPKFVTVTTNPSDPTHTTIIYTDLATGVTVTQPILAGSYDVFVEVSGGSYFAEAHGTLVIHPKPIIAIVPNSTKEYDGNKYLSPIPTLSFAPGEIETNTLTTILDDIQATGSLAYFDDKNVGNPKNLTISGIMLSGAASSNYVVDDLSVNTNSSITKKSIINGAYVQVDTTTKIYDGNTLVTRLPELTVKNLIGTDVITANYDVTTTATFDTKDVGKGKVVTIANILLGGADLNNYDISNTATNVSSEIKVLPLDESKYYIEVDTTTKYYDGTVNVIRLPALTAKGLIGSDKITASYDSNTTALFDTKHVGTNKTVTISNIVLSGADAANYTINKTAQNNNCEIKRLKPNPSIYIELNSSTKIYDGTDISEPPSLTIKGLLSGDELTVVANRAYFSSINAGTQPLNVDLSDMLFSNSTLANNYFWEPKYSNNLSSITRKVVVVTPDAGQERKFNEPEPIFTFTTAPTPLPNGDILQGELDREPGNDVGLYHITQGTVDNANNPNYDIVFNQANVTFEIFSGLVVEKKWGYTLVVNNSANEYKAYQWYKNGALVPGETKQYYSKEKPLCGVYKVLVTLNDGTEVFSQDSDETASCNQIVGAISIYPNLLKSSSNVIVSSTITETTDLSVYSVKVISMAGVVVGHFETEFINDFKFQAPSASGTYIVKIFNNEIEVATNKLIVF